MFEEFRLHRDAVREMTILAGIRVFIVLAILPLILLIRYLEGDISLMNVVPGAFGIWFGFVGIISTVRILRARQYAIHFKLLCLGDHLKFSRGLAEVNLPFSSISKVVLQPDGSFMIYTSGRVPFLYISRHLERKELLLSILSSSARIEHSSSKHLIGDPVNRLAIYGLFMLLAVTFLVSQTPMVVVPSGLLLIGYLSFQVYFLSSHRAHLNNPLAIVILAIMALFFLARMLLLLSGHSHLFNLR